MSVLQIFVAFGLAVVACRGERLVAPAAPPAPDSIARPDSTPRRSRPGTTHHVAVSGSARGDGSIERPWDLATALADPPAVQPGDTILIAGGTYADAYVSALTGTREHPIIVRAARGERVTIATPEAQPTSLTINGAHTWFRDLEITNTADTPPPWGGGAGVYVAASEGIRLIHLVIHDAWASGIQWGASARGGVVYGVISYANGRNSILSPGKGGYGIYAQSNTGVTIQDNIFGRQGGNYSIHVYAEQVSIDDVHLVGNIVDGGGGGRWVHVGGFRPAKRTVLRENLIHGSGVDLGYQDRLFGAGTVDARVEDNIFATGDRSLVVSHAAGDFRFSGNTVVGAWDGVGPKSHPGNTFLTSPPAEPWVRIRPSAYEPGRAHVAVYNWPHGAAVRVDLSTVLDPGDPFIVHDAFDPFGTPVTEGIYEGPLMLDTHAAEFCVYVVRRPAPAP